MNELRGMIYSRFKTETECAKQLGWPKQKLNYITNGKRLPNIKDTVKLAETLQVDIDKIISIFLSQGPTKR